MTTEELLDEVDRLDKEASPGPWRDSSFSSGSTCVTMRMVAGDMLNPDKSSAMGYLSAHVTLYNLPAFQVMTGLTEEKLDDEKRWNAAFIARARTLLPELAKRLRETLNRQA